MKLTKQLARALYASLAATAVAAPILAFTYSPDKTDGDKTTTRGMAVSYPWAFKNGTATARTTALRTSEGILRKAGYASIPGDLAKATWITDKMPKPRMRTMPSLQDLRSYAEGLDATVVLYGSISWHTRSIWVNAGPKTISTATVDVYVYDLASKSVIYKNLGVQGRSDERSSNYKIAAAVLFTPFVTAVSGGPATPREERAAQIALGLAYHDWVIKE